MGLFSFLGNKKQGSTSGKPEYNSGSEENSRGSSDRSTRSKKQLNGATQASSDTALPEKKRARRRLIGAVALVIAAIIVLPMLFDSEQKTVSNDIAIQIPSVDTPTPVKTPVVPDSKPVPNPPDAAGASSSGSVSVSTGLDQQEEFIALTPAPAPEIVPAPVTASTATQPAPMAPIPETRHVAKPEPKPEPKPTPKQAEKVDESARARAILEGRSVTVATAKTSSKFALQVAALTSQKSVDELQGKLTAAGIKSYTQKAGTQSGSPIRVRVGPFSSKEEAEKMHAKMVKLGFGGAVVPLN
ncbi:MAG: SPOR domain-containing protein [Burkholderiaceae bacterium]